MKKIILFLGILFIVFSSFSAFANPKRIFSIDKTEGRGPLTVKFDAKNIKPAKKFYWNFGNGEVLMTENPIVNYTFKTPGTYTASLKFTVNASDKELENLKDAGNIQINVLGEVNVAPTASISCSTDNMLVTCNALGSFDPEGQPLSYQFLYSDGFIESNTNGLSSHAFSLAGLYTVKLIVTDNASATSEVTTQVQALSSQNLLPVVALNCFSNNLNTLTCNATGSYDPDGTIFAFRYEWDDNSFDVRADSSNFSHFFNSSGNHTVTLKAVDDKGGVSSITKSFEVKANSAPIASFECVNMGPLSVHCNSTSFDLDGFIVSSRWTIDDGAVFEGFGFDHTFISGDTHQITLTLTDNLGVKNSLSKQHQLLINQAPSFNLITSATSGFVPLNVNFRADNIVDDGSITSVEWDFGDNETATDGVVSHTFLSAGTYNVVAKVTDDLGGITTKTVSIVVQNTPFMANLECTTNNLFVMCNALGTYNPSDFPLIYSFNYDDGFVETNTTGLSSHGYSAAGSYNVKLTVTNGLGLSSEKSIMVMPVLPENIIPVASLSCKADGVLKVTCNTQSSDEDGTVASVVYIFDDGVVLNSAPGVEISHIFATAGEHTISAVAIDFDGGNSLQSKTVVTIIDEILEDGIFIGGVDSIDLNRHEKLGEYYFSIYKRENGQVNELEDQNISLQEIYPGIEISFNRIQIKSSEFFEEIPEEFTLNVNVEGINYSKTIIINKKVSKLVGTIPAGNLSTYTIQNENSSLDGTLLTFEDGQLVDQEMQIFETKLSDGIIALNFEQSSGQPMAYNVVNLTEGMIGALSSSNDLHFGFSNSTFIRYWADTDELSQCTKDSTAYFIDKNKVIEMKEIKQSKEQPAYLYYLFSIGDGAGQFKDVDSYIAKYSATNNKVKNVISKFLEKFQGINFVFVYEATERKHLAMVNKQAKDTIMINFASAIGSKSEDTILGTLLHEKRHLQQVEQLGCSLLKLSTTNQKIFLESEAEYSVTKNNLNSAFVNGYMRESIFNLSIDYFDLASVFNGTRGITEVEENAYRAGMLWDHLNFDEFVWRVKSLYAYQTSEMYFYSPSAFLKKLYGSAKYYNFVSELLISFYYPYSENLTYTQQVANLYFILPPFRPSFYYTYSDAPTVQKNYLLTPQKSSLNILDYKKLTESIPDIIKSKKENLRFKLFIFPSDDESFYEGYKNIFASLSNVGDHVSSRVSEVLWKGDGSEPSENEFIVDFDKFDLENGQVQVLLSNGDRENVVQVNTLVVTEVRKKICYYSKGERGTESLRVTFIQKGDDPLGEYPYGYIDGTLQSGECKEFFLAYNVPYFFEFLVAPASVMPDIVEFGLYTSWDYQAEDFAYNFEMNDVTGLQFNADLVPVNQMFYKIKMDVLKTSDGTIWIMPD